MGSTDNNTNWTDQDAQRDTIQRLVNSSGLWNNVSSLCITISQFPTLPPHTMTTTTATADMTTQQSNNVYDSSYAYEMLPEDIYNALCNNSNPESNYNSNSNGTQHFELTNDSFASDPFFCNPFSPASSSSSYFSPSSSPSTSASSPLYFYPSAFSSASSSSSVSPSFSLPSSPSVALPDPFSSLMVPQQLQEQQQSQQLQPQQQTQDMSVIHTSNIFEIVDDLEPIQRRSYPQENRCLRPNPLVFRQRPETKAYCKISQGSVTIQLGRYRPFFISFRLMSLEVSCQIFFWFWVFSWHEP